jgi:hypothetical protein
MTGIHTKIKVNTVETRRRYKRAVVKSLGGAAAYVMKVAKRKIKQSEKPSKKGRPPHTRRGALRRAIVFAVNENGEFALVGPSADLFSNIAKYHEFGGYQELKTRRRKYKIGSGGPVDIRGDYRNPNYSKDRHIAGMRFERNSAIKGVAWARLKTRQQVDRAKALDLAIFPDSKKLVKYAKRPFMAPALHGSLHAITANFKAELNRA